MVDHKPRVDVVGRTDLSDSAEQRTQVVGITLFSRQQFDALFNLLILVTILGKVIGLIVFRHTLHQPR